MIDKFFSPTGATGFLIDFLKLIGYFLLAASSALVIRKLIKVPKELFRKLLHFILLGSTPVFLYLFSSWQSAVLGSLLFAILVYPALSLAEHIDGYSKLLVERERGEIKRSLMLVFGMISLVIFLCWGILNAKYLALAVILSWGLGDAAAALVGKKFGRHHLKGKYIDKKKTLEGTMAMFIISFFTVFLVLIFNVNLAWYGYLLISAITSVVVSLVELSTKNGFDTLTCPVANLAIMIPLLYLCGGIM